MPIYEFKCVEGGETTAHKMTVQEYVDLKERYSSIGLTGVCCFEHKSNCKRVFGIFSFRM